MTAHDCLQSTLVEALHDGRLGPPERASIARHLAVCASCRALARDIEAIRGAIRAPQEAASQLAHQRARQALLGRAPEIAAAPPAAGVRPLRGGRALLLMAAALAIAAGIGWFGGRATAPLSRADRALNAPAPPAPVETTVKPSGSARFERARSPGLDVVTLTSGAIDVQVHPADPHDRFVVRTGDAEIHAGRASFRVEADQGRIRSVTVESESVEVRYAGAIVVMTSGGSWRAGDGPAIPPPVAVASPTPPSLASPEADAPTMPESAAPAPNEPRTPRPPPQSSAASPRGSRGGAPGPGPARKRGAGASAPDAPGDAPIPAPSPTASNVSGAARSSSREFAEAMQAVAAGDYAAGAARLETFAAAHPDHPRADEAEYVRAAALQRAGRAAEAAAAAKHYLSTRANGAHRVEAKQIAGE